MFCFKILFLNARAARAGRAAVVSCRAFDACSGPRSKWRVSVPGFRLTNDSNSSTATGTAATTLPALSKLHWPVVSTKISYSKKTAWKCGPIM